MGIVYQAYDPRLDRRVALKVMKADLVASETFVQRFLKEARAVARLTHPNIVSIYDADEDQGAIYLAMELLAGESLDKLIRKRKFSEKRSFFWGSRWPKPWIMPIKEVSFTVISNRRTSS